MFPGEAAACAKACHVSGCMSIFWVRTKPERRSGPNLEEPLRLHQALGVYPFGGGEMEEGF